MKEEVPEKINQENTANNIPLNAEGAAKLIEELEEKEEDRKAIKDSDEFKNRGIH